jgi:tetraacyldisaccharide 4'-kinase
VIRAENVWYGDGIMDRAVRLALRPLSGAYAGGVALRNALFDRGFLVEHRVDLPTVSVGNLSVGGTGKTPLAAWLAASLSARGARPAVVLRGYGQDETAVHRELNPGVPVIVAPNRLRGIARARAAGCDIAVLDDGFQHRRASRVEDIVLISADRWREPLRVLPAGPWREPLSSLGRASMLIVTRKAASAEAAHALSARLSRVTRTGFGAVVALPLGELRSAPGGASLTLEALRGKRVLAVAGIGDPAAFTAQLLEKGIAVRLMRFQDHHRYTREDADRIATCAKTEDLTVCTLKDAVKLRDIWPREAPSLWYFSQRVEVEDGEDRIEALLQRLLDARRLTTTTTAS